jgi:type II secretory pathway component PulF
MGPAAAMLPGVGALGGAASSVAAGVATQAIMTAATAGMQQQAMDSLLQVQSGSVKAKDEITLTYQLVTMSGAKPPLEDALKAKAEQDGQDLLSPLVEQLATAAVTAALQP